MTVIAWRGDLLAADKQETVDCAKIITRKLHAVGDCAIAVCGYGTEGHVLEHWFRDGAYPANFPLEQQTRERGNATRLIVLRPQGCVEYLTSPIPMPVYGEYCAWGVGRDAALAAMYCGADAVEAVRAANYHVEGCGMGVDVVKIPQVK